MSASYTVTLMGGANVPMTTEEVVSAYNAGVVKAETPVWREGLEDWAPLAELASELGVTVKARAPLPPPHVGIAEPPPEEASAPAPASVAIAFRPRVVMDERTRAEALAQEAHLKRAKVCGSCGHTGRPLKRTKGSANLEALLWLCFVVPGVFYSLWRRRGAEACFMCGHTELKPLMTEELSEQSA